jgi:hypothetical protein
MASRLATHDDDPGVRPDAHAFIFDKAPWFMVTDDLPQYPARIPGQNLPTITDRSHPNAVCAATVSVWLAGPRHFASTLGRRT